MNIILILILFIRFYIWIVLFFLFLRFFFKPKLLITSLIIVLLLLIPSLYKLITDTQSTSLFKDTIKTIKYLTPFFCFLFFVEFHKNANDKASHKLMQLVQFSYIILVANIYLKYIGLGYPAYEHGDIGSKGFFFAGNELSALLIILSAIVGFRLWLHGKKKNYYLFLIFNLLTALTISSKTAILGIILVFFAIPFQKKSLKLKNLFLLATSTVVLLPILLLLSWKFIQNSNLILRIQYFYEKFDLATFILSSRNVFLKNSYETYLHEYSITEKIIGVGNTKYELLNDNKVVEMDVVDIFFTYGFIGLFIFTIMIFFLLVQAKRMSKIAHRPYGGFVFLLAIVLLLISTIAGHVFGSGMSAVFIGLLFSLMYVKKRVPRLWS